MAWRIVPRFRPTRRVGERGRRKTGGLRGVPNRNACDAAEESAAAACSPCEARRSGNRRSAFPRCRPCSMTRGAGCRSRRKRSRRRRPRQHPGRVRRRRRLRASPGRLREQHSQATGDGQSCAIGQRFQASGSPFALHSTRTILVPRAVAAPANRSRFSPARRAGSRRWVGRVILCGRSELLGLLLPSPCSFLISGRDDRHALAHPP